MFNQTPDRRVLAFRATLEMADDIEREAQKRHSKISEEVRRRLDFYDRHYDRRAEKPASHTAK
jgi:hypothetical protein